MIRVVSFAIKCNRNYCWLNFSAKLTTPSIYIWNGPIFSNFIQIWRFKNLLYRFFWLLYTKKIQWFFRIWNVSVTVSAQTVHDWPWPLCPKPIKAVNERIMHAFGRGLGWNGRETFQKWKNHCNKSLILVLSDSAYGLVSMGAAWRPMPSLKWDFDELPNEMLNLFKSN